jgi:small GTP-binding protein
MSENKEFEKDFIFKICVIGDGAAGKTSLIKRFTQGSFNKDYIKTLGAQFSRYEKVLGAKGEIRARLFFWDIAGQAEFSFMRPTFYNGAKATVCVFDLTRDETRDNVATWIDDISKYCGNLPTVCFGNKSDLLDDETKYDDSKIKSIADEKKFLNFYKTSAKTGKHVQDAFNSIIDILVEQALKNS